MSRLILCTRRNGTLRARPLEEKIAATQRFAAQVVPWLARSLVRPIVDSVFAFEDVRAALLRLESNQVFGKVVLRIGEGLRAFHSPIQG